jgi:ubiquinol-cytochrome c reductase iron-sulfur subunit
LSDGEAKADLAADGDVSSQKEERASYLSAEVNLGRRYFIIGATGGVASVGVVGAAIPFLQYWQPSAKAKALGAPVKIDISKLRPGEILSPILSYRGQPVFVIYRDEESLALLKEDSGRLADPNSESSEQPEFALNPYRSSRPEIGVFLGICTHLGCSPKHQVANVFPDSEQGGFFCPCHGSGFDLAGRVAAGVPAPTNLIVPPYRFSSDTEIIVGELEADA